MTRFVVKRTKITNLNKSMECACCGNTKEYLNKCLECLVPFCETCRQDNLHCCNDCDNLYCHYHHYQHSSCGEIDYQDGDER